MNISLSPEHRSLVQSFLDSGNYGSAVDVIGEALMLLEKQKDLREEKQETLRKELLKGWESIQNGSYSKRTVEEIGNDVLRNHQNG